jgi:hypothetical protein
VPWIDFLDCSASMHAFDLCCSLELWLTEGKHDSYCVILVVLQT